MWNGNAAGVTDHVRERVFEDVREDLSYRNAAEFKKYDVALIAVPLEKANKNIFK